LENSTVKTAQMVRCTLQ